jgi:hypothetical protein
VKRQAIRDPFKPQATEPSLERGPSNSGCGAAAGGNRNRGRAAGNNWRYDNSNAAGGNRQASFPANSTCPLDGHQGHNWGQCQRNPSNPNRRPFQGRGGGNPGRNAPFRQQMTNNRSYNNRNPNEAHLNDNAGNEAAPARAAAPRPRQRCAVRQASNEDNKAHYMEAEEATPSSGGDDFESFYMAEGFDLKPELYESDDEDMPVLTRRVPKRYDSDDDSPPDLLPCTDQYDSDDESDCSSQLPGLISRGAYYGSDSDSDTDDDDDEPMPNNPYVPMSYSAPEEDVVPQTIMTVKSMTGVGITPRLFRVLLDSGATFEAMIKASSIPDNVVPTKIPSINVRTTNGSFKIDESVKLKGMKFPEFSFTSHLAPIKAVVFDSESCGYDIILGRACLKKMGVSLDFAKSMTTWLGIKVPFRSNSKHPSMYQEANAQVNPVRVERAQEAYQASAMTCSRYFEVSTDEVLETLTHLNDEQKTKLGAVLERHTELFSGKIGVYPHRKFHIELSPDAVPHYQMRSYPIKRDVLPVLKDELAHQEKNGIIKRCYESEWCLPLFAVPKKHNEIRTVRDLRMLNKWVIRKQYPLPQIQDIFHRRRAYKMMSKLDISMQYYTFLLDEESTWLCVFVTPFGKYRYLRLPMGLNQSPNWAQATMEKIFHDMMDEIEIYIDDIGVYDTDFDTHLKKLEVILSRLEANGFTVNPLKCEWCVQETDFLGFWMTPTGIKPWKKRVEPILAMQTPQTLRLLPRHVAGPLTCPRAVDGADQDRAQGIQEEMVYRARRRFQSNKSSHRSGDPSGLPRSEHPVLD